MAKSQGRKPKLPAKQLAILAVARFAEPLGLTSVFPYLPEMIKSFGVEQDEVARWAGLTGAVFSLAQSLTAVPWGKASDTFGRKPAILIGLTSTMICFLLWGLSTSLPTAITVRAIMGAGSGNVGIIRTMVAEMVPERELQPKAFSIMPMVWSIGSVFGPAFGGFLARPADQYPSLFGDHEFLKKYPFALPNIVACVVFAISLLTGLLFLKETLETKRHARDWGLILGEKLTHPFSRTKKHAQRRRLSLVDDEAQAPLIPKAGVSAVGGQKAPPAKERMFNTQVVLNLVSYTFLALHSVTFDQLLPVFLNYPRQVPNEDNTHFPFHFSGGFGLTSGRIGTIYTIYGIACGVIQFFLFPPLCARFGVLTCFRVSALIFPFVYLLTPYTALIQDDVTRYAAFLAIMFVKGCIVVVGFPCTTILLTNSATSLRVLGTLNGMATAYSGLGRALGPAMTGVVFSFGVQRGYMIVPWWLLAGIALLGALPSWKLVEGEGPHRPRSEEQQEGEEDADASPLSDGETSEDDVGPEQRRASAPANGAEDVVAPGLEDPEEVTEDICPPLLDPGSPTRPWHGKAPTSPTRVKLRRMSTTGKDLERAQ